MTPAVATPDLARDIFSGLWDQSEDLDLFSAYTSLDQDHHITDLALDTAAPSPVYSQSPSSDYSVEDIERASQEMNNPYYANQGDRTPPSSKCTQLALMLLAQSQGQNLSRAEEEKRRVRRERNKVAATKCREKRKAHSSYVRHEYSKVTDTTKQLEDQITLLRREKDELQKILQSHECRIPEQQQQLPTVRLQQHQPQHQQMIPQRHHTVQHYRQHTPYEQAHSVGQR